MRREVVIVIFGLLLFVGCTSKKTAQELVKKGDSYLFINRYEEAIAAYSLAIQKDSLCLIAFSQRGRAKVQLQQFSSALIDLDKAIEAGFYDKYTYYYRGVSHLFLRNMDMACKDWKKATALGYPGPDIILGSYCR